MKIPTDLREPINPRITIKRASRDHAYISVDGRGVATVADLAYFETMLAAIEEKVSASANRDANLTDKEK